jgi:hypothetical protein
VVVRLVVEGSGVLRNEVVGAAVLVLVSVWQKQKGQPRSSNAVTLVATVGRHQHGVNGGHSLLAAQSAASSTRQRNRAL